MRRFALLTGGIAAALALAWSAGWLWIARDVENRVEAWIADRRAEGMAAAHGGIHVGGWPTHWRLHVARPEMAGAGAAGWRWRGDAVEAELLPWQVREIPFRLLGRQDLKAEPDVAASIEAARAEGMAKLGPDGRIVDLALDFDGAMAVVNGEPVAAREAMAQLRIAPAPAPGNRPATFSASLAFADIDLPPTLAAPLGRRVRSATLALAFLGKLPAGRFAEALAAWRDDGGTIEIPKLALSWGGVAFDGAGTVAVDAENRPIGAGIVRLAGYNEAIDALVRADRIRPIPAAGLKIGLAIAARPGPDGRPQVEAPFRAQDGTLFVRFAGQDIALARVAPIVKRE